MDGGNSGKQISGGSPTPLGNPQQASKSNGPNSLPSSEPLFRYTNVSEMYGGRAIAKPPSSDLVMSDLYSLREPCKLCHGYYECPLGFNCPYLNGMYGLQNWKVGGEIGNPSRKRKADELYYGFPASGSKGL